MTKIHYFFSNFSDGKVSFLHYGNKNEEFSVMVMQIIFSHYGNENLEITVLKCHENNVTIQKKKKKTSCYFLLILQ